MSNPRITGKVHGGKKWLTTAISGILVVSATARLSAQLPSEESSVDSLVAFEARNSTDAKNLDSILQSISMREQEVAKREAALETQKLELDNKRQMIREEVSKLRRAQEELESTLGLAKKSAAADVSSLVQFYENMKPQQASEIFSLMDDTLAAGFLGKMQPAVASAILANLTPEKSYAISVVLAGRNVR